MDLFERVIAAKAFGERATDLWFQGQYEAVESVLKQEEQFLVDTNKAAEVPLDTPET